jgi:hypothetical protein
MSHCKQGGLAISTAYLGLAQKNCSLYSGSIQMVRDLMDDGLDEEPFSKSSNNKAVLLPLSRSLTVDGVKFSKYWLEIICFPG